MTLSEKLNQKIPEGVVMTRSSDGKVLSYLSGGYVVKRLNDVLGQGKWAYVSNISGINRRENTASCIAQVSLTAEIDDRRVTFTDYGFCEGNEEMAVKGSITDGLKRCAKNLGISLGLGLYLKESEYAVTSETPEASPAAPTVNAGVGNSGDIPTAVPVKETSTSTPDAAAPRSNRVTKDLIKAAFGVLKERKETTAEGFKTKYLNGGKVADLTDDAAGEVFTRIKADFPQLQLT